jgi:hypothetical protein
MWRTITYVVMLFAALSGYLHIGAVALVFRSVSILAISDISCYKMLSYGIRSGKFRYDDNIVSTCLLFSQSVLYDLLSALATWCLESYP